ncbi:hypothetical protein LZ24_01846 [Desulfobotulus alkaliphilus]|uniref:Uncharacterized protein n=1 Tax=Desulfobotulus alkaliphilus TaxID=622671 RepID=A0A562RRT0_9BACT|nr:hypothetical protein [Desulfobotulus alkaliphilus]TWI71829.1 hypothetical protein LZ24_01846 [Desulfobotulus alkaliphilus]
MQDQNDYVKDKIITLLNTPDAGKDQFRSATVFLLKEYEILFQQLRILEAVRGQQKETIDKQNEKKLLHDELVKALKSNFQRLNSTNQKLKAANAEIRERQRILVRLVGEISRIQVAGDRHSLRNMALIKMESARTRAIEAVTAQIMLLYHYSSGNESHLAFLHTCCSPFGITATMFQNPEQIRIKLMQLVLDDPSDTQTPKTFHTNDKDSFLSSFLPEETCFSEAYRSYLDILKRFQGSGLPSLLLDTDIFGLFLPVLEIRKLGMEMNLRLTAMDNLIINEKLPFSEILQQAFRQACLEKSSQIQILEDLKFNPVFNTNSKIFSYVLRDLIYNAIDAGATEILVSSSEEAPSKTELPRSFSEGAVFYLCLGDNGTGMTKWQVKTINQYLSGSVSFPDSLSEKPGGGQGSRSLKDFLPLHRASCYYVSNGSGTRVHLFFSQTDIMGGQPSHHP